MTDRNNNIPYELSDYVLGKYFRTTGENQGWLPENGRSALVSVSGGGDSVALMWLFSKFYNGKVFAIHINHKIRGEESDQDQNFVRNIAEEFNVELKICSVDVPNLKYKGESLETAARRLRLSSIISENENSIHSDNVFLGHNRDDLAETVLFNILRGTGIRGSVGMTESSVIGGTKFYRPLLGLRREFLRDILRVRGIKWREDSTNSDTEYTRNFIRLKLIPEINEKINSSAVEHLASFGEQMRAVRDREDSISLELFNQCIDSINPLTLNRKILWSLNDSETALVIREAGRRLELKTLSRGRCQELSDLIQKPGNFIFQWCGDMTVKSEKGKIIFTDLQKERNYAD